MTLPSGPSHSAVEPSTEFYFQLLQFQVLKFHLVRCDIFYVFAETFCFSFASSMAISQWELVSMMAVF